jgi:hypothetical protein
MSRLGKAGNNGRRRFGAASASRGGKIERETIEG